MEQIKLLGTRFTIYSGNCTEFLESFGTSGYTYTDAILSNDDSDIFISDRKNIVRDSQGFTTLSWLKRETKINSGSLEPITDKEYKTLLIVCKAYVDKMMDDRNRQRNTRYLAPVEAIIGNTGDKELIECFYKSTRSIENIRGLLVSRLASKEPVSTYTNKVASFTNVKYNRYSITNLIEDLVADKASLIMDDSIYKYNWQSRIIAGYGNIKPIIESGELYPVYQISGVQGNQARANLSLKFDFKVNYDAGTSIKILEVSRNLLLIQDGLRFQNMIAVRTSKNLKKKLKRLGLVDAELPRQTDYIISLKTLGNSSRNKQYNRSLSVLSRQVCRWKVLSDEQEAIYRLIQWTPEEIKSRAERAAASSIYYNINKQSRATASFARKLYRVNVKTSVPKDLGKGLTQEQLRKSLKEIRHEISKLYTSFTNQIYEYLCSNKTWKEFFRSRQRVTMINETIPGFFGNMYNCNFSTT